MLMSSKVMAWMLLLFDAILPTRALDIRLQEDWGRYAGEDPRVIMSLRVDFEPMVSMSLLFFLNIRIIFPSFRPCILAILVV